MHSNIIKRSIVKRNNKLNRALKVERVVVKVECSSRSLSNRLRALLRKLGIPEHRVSGQEPL